jgi:hypothetical protein
MYFTNTSNSNSATNTKAENAPIHLNNRYRPRDTGVGYGKSSGYASTRRYANNVAISLVRVR